MTVASAPAPVVAAPAAVSVCPVCGTPLEAEDTFCIGCGRPAASAAQPASEPQFASAQALSGGPATTGCPYCGAELEVDDAFCTGCGRAAAPSAATPVMATPAGPPVASGVVIDPSTPDTCPACGINLKSDERFCRGCGRLIKRSKH